MGCRFLSYVIRTLSLFHHVLVLLFFVWASFYSIFFPNGSKTLMNMFRFPCHQLRIRSREREHLLPSGTHKRSEMDSHWPILEKVLNHDQYLWTEGWNMMGFPLGSIQALDSLEYIKILPDFLTKKEFTKEVIGRFI